MTNYFKNVAQKCQQNWSSAEDRLPENLSKMMRERFVLFVLLATLLMVACLLTILIISRNIGQPQEEQLSGEQSSQLKFGEEKEERQIELVDLIECDKTFAFTRWRLRVLVPKTKPVYNQHNRFLKEQTSQKAPDTESTTKHTEAQKIELADSNKRTILDAPADTINDERYFLTSTSQFVDEAIEGSQSSELRMSRNESTKRENPQDPFELASSELGFSLTSLDLINSSVVDCFIVDTEKRLEQKSSIEKKHQQVASTRPVSFSKMLSVIQACRQLTWSALEEAQRKQLETSSSRNSNLAPPIVSQLKNLKPTTTSDTFITTTKPPEVDKRHREQMSRRIKRAAVGSSRSPANPLLHQIQPVQPRSTSHLAGSPQKAPETSDPLSGLLNLFMFWNESANAEKEPNEVGKSEPRHWTTTTSGVARVVDTSQLIKPTGAPDRTKVSNEDDEAQRVSYFNMGMSMVSGIVPNTLWCGFGDRASNYSELGAEYQVDSCCRAHDHCPIRLKPFTADYGLINWSMSTRSHCDCDLDFNDCLAQVNSTLSNVIKTLYFRFVGLQCIDIESRHPDYTNSNNSQQLG